ncbi:lytic transglycosylase domain-containing protein [Aliishimia ponticola]|uniref:Lytic transglycosylase domain-containing protein n=1 Tax=Aliishimia ponticola TaxID=2499833 RepID=A0A4S4NCR8_9RHOB|nr:lytic transglycosylase domain-containing protein [Aliishimia ponticola]THH37242.1 lytic transglycosylase domain-containing protein [Aliishimia ponticola]
MKKVKALFILGAFLLAEGAVAETPAPFPDFSAKHVKAPKASSTKRRITVQIDPSEQSAAQPKAPMPEASANAAPAPDVPGRYPWFWEKVSPDLALASAGRLEGAMHALAGASTKVPAPRLQALQEIAGARGVEILGATVGTRVSPALVLAVISVESAGQADAQSTAGAQGLMQLMPDTAARFGVENSFEPSQNIAGGVKYLDWLMGEFDGDPLLVLAAYNAGEGSVRNHQGVPPFAETRDYVPKVLAAFQVARGLCRTPPVLASDGCVFALMQ